MSEIYTRDNFINVKFNGLARDLLWFLSLVDNYNDGQGRKFDILDSEIHD